MCKKLLAVAALVLMAAWGSGGSLSLVGQEQEKEFIFKGRLPAYYADIVTDHQKAVIYTIQAKYQAKIAALNEELEAVTKQQDKEIEDVLTPEQKKMLKTAQETGAAKRKKTAEDKKMAEAAKAAAPAPAQAKRAVKK
jgi:hypothetical protein